MDGREVDDVEAEVGDVGQAVDDLGKRSVPSDLRLGLTGVEHRRTGEELVPGAEGRHRPVDHQGVRPGTLLVAHPPVEPGQLALVEVGLEPGGELAIDARLQRRGMVDPRLDDELVASERLDHHLGGIARPLHLLHRVVDHLTVGRRVAGVDDERHVLVAEHDGLDRHVVARDPLHGPRAPLDGRAHRRDRQPAGAGGGDTGRRRRRSRLPTPGARHYWAARTAKS